MYGLTVQDLWCVSKRKVIMDPAFRQTKSPDRVKEEVDFYKIDYYKPLLLPWKRI